MFVNITCVKCVIEEKGKILFIKEAQESSWKPGTWSLPGGKIDPKETYIDAFHRELFEETGLKAELGKLIETVEIVCNIEGSNRLVHHFIVTAHQVTGNLKQPDYHTAGFKWFSMAEIEKMSVYEFSEYYYQDMLKDYFNTKTRKSGIIRIINAFEDKRVSDWQKNEK